MGRRKHHHTQATPAQARQSAPSRAVTWKIGLGIAGIILAILVLVFADDLIGGPSPDPVPAGEPQVVRVSVEGYEFVPDRVTVKAGAPVTFIVDGTRAQGCARYFVIPDFGVSKLLDKGENTFTFTPTKKGTYIYSCSMRMVVGWMDVV